MSKFGIDEFLKTFDPIKMYKASEFVKKVQKQLKQKDKTIESLVEEKYTLYGDGYGFLAECNDKTQVWVNSTSIALEQKDKEIEELKEEIKKLRKNGKK